MQVITDKLHPALTRELNIEIEYNLVFDCFEAASQWGYETFWKADLDTKEAMIAYVKSRKVLDSILQWESRELAKEEAKRENG